MNGDICGFVQVISRRDLRELNEGESLAIGPAGENGVLFANILGSGKRRAAAGRGAGRKDDTLPYRVMNEPIPKGPAKGRCCLSENVDAMLDRYYALRGWTSDGIPTNEKLAELGLKSRRPAIALALLAV